MFKIFKHTISSQEKIRITKLVYNKSWDEGSSIVLREISRSEAEKYAQALVVEKGWRERVTGALIVHVYELEMLVPNYIESFRVVPESHTCHAFIKMLSFLPDDNQRIYREQLASMCSDDKHGLHLLSIINTYKTKE